jgi:transposase
MEPGRWRSPAPPDLRAERICRDIVIRQVTDVPVVGRKLRLQVRVPRDRSVAIGCDREVLAHKTDRLARRGRTMSWRWARYRLRRLMMVDRATVAVRGPRIRGCSGTT